MLLPNSVEGFSPEMYVAALAEVVRSDGLHAAEIAILEEHAGRFGIDLDRLPALPANLRALPAATRVLVYRDAYMLAMADGEFSEPEATRLGELAGRLGLASAATELIIEWADDYSTLLARFEDLVRGVKEGSEVIDAAATATVRARANIYGNATSESRINHLAQFYTFLERLGEGVGGARLLSQCTGLMAWPRRGVYFFFEPNELRTDSGTGPRVVRVGTHAVAAGARTTLWNRLSSHRGVAATGGGNHRGSIFRLLVGTALMRSQLSGAVDTWGRAPPPAERHAKRKSHWRSRSPR